MIRLYKNRSRHVKTSLPLNVTWVWVWLTSVRQCVASSVARWNHRRRLTTRQLQNTAQQLLQFVHLSIFFVTFFCLPKLPGSLFCFHTSWREYATPRGRRTGLGLGLGLVTDTGYVTMYEKNMLPGMTYWVHDTVKVVRCAHCTAVLSSVVSSVVFTRRDFLYSSLFRHFCWL